MARHRLPNSVDVRSVKKEPLWLGEYKPPSNPLYDDWRKQKDTIPSVDNRGVAVVQSAIKYEDPELVAREAAAQEEIARKKKRVGITVNKSCYQYLGDDYDATTLGRK